MSESPRLLVEPGRVKLSGSWTLAEMLPRLPALQADLAACPSGIDGHFENVGGMILDAVLLRANAFSRIAMCGMIAGYNGEPIPLAAPQLILVNRMKVQGFIVSEHMQHWPQGSSRTSPNPGAFPGNGRRLAAQGGCQSTRHDRLVRPVAA